MYKTFNNKRILTRVSIWLLATVMLISALPLTAAATETFKNTTVITALKNGETSVGTTAEFAKAAADVRVNKIILKNNLIFSEFQQYSRKTTGDLVIDGGGKYFIKVTKSDWWQGCVDPTNHVSMEFKEGYSKVTFRNIVLMGEAFNGFVYAKDGTNLAFENMSFDGPALAFLKNSLKKSYSTVTIKDCNINLRKRYPDSKDTAKNNYLYPSEAVDMGFGSIILAGNVNITKEDPKNGTLDHDEIFYFKEKEGDITVEPGAVVDIKNYSRVMGSEYWSGLVYISCCLADININVGKNAIFNYYGEGGIIVEGYALESFNVAENAKVNFQVSTPTESHTARLVLLDTGSYLKSRAINVQRNAKFDVIALNNINYPREAVVAVEKLNVNENATFRVIASGNSVSELALKMQGKSPSIYLDRPDEVLLYNGNKPTSAKGETHALQAAKAIDVPTTDIDFAFVGAGIRMWNAADNRIDLKHDSAKDTWTVDPKRATTWTTSVRDKQFTLGGAISKKDGTFLRPVLVDTKKYLQVAVRPGNDPTRGIGSFSNRSVILFNGSAAPIAPIAPPEPAPAPAPEPEPAPAPKNYDLKVYYYTGTNPGPVANYYDSEGAKAQGDGYCTSTSGTDINTLDHVVYEPNGVMNNGAGPYTAKAEKMKFVGWNTKMDGTGIMVYPGQRLFADAKVPRSQSQNLYAVWASAPSIKYDLNGGKGVNFSDEGDGSDIFTVSTKMIDYSKNGYLFVGWNTQDDGKGTVYRCGSTYELKEPLTLYAQFLYLGIE